MVFLFFLEVEPSGNVEGQYESTPTINLNRLPMPPNTNITSIISNCIGDHDRRLFPVAITSFGLVFIAVQHQTKLTRRSSAISGVQQLFKIPTAQLLCDQKHVIADGRSNNPELEMLREFGPHKTYTTRQNLTL
jgi:hypothetical protein